MAAPLNIAAALGLPEAVLQQVPEITPEIAGADPTGPGAQAPPAGSGTQFAPRPFAGEVARGEAQARAGTGQPADLRDRFFNLLRDQNFQAIFEAGQAQKAASTAALQSAGILPNTPPPQAFYQELPAPNISLFG